MIIAIDGPSGSGKSSVARAVAERLGFVYLDTGAMYRSVALTCLYLGLDPSNAEVVTGVASNIMIRFYDVDGVQHVFANDVDITDEIRTPEVDQIVSTVAAVPSVRKIMVEQQRRIALSRGLVAEGRDIGSTVFPKAEVKVFLTASPEVRARRRSVQRKGGDLATGVVVEVDENEERRILENLRYRDEIDSTRDVTPLRVADGACVIDSTDLTFEEVVDKIVELTDGAVQSRSCDVWI